MYGFLNNEYKLRRLDSDTDISYIYDTVSEAVSAPHTKASLITYENNKLRTRYAEYLKARELPPSGSDISITDTIAEITTDDERIVLYYILHENVRKVSKSTISSWLNKCEIRGVNVDNAFDLLSSFDNGAVNNDTLEFGIDTFRKYSANAAQILPPLKKCVDQHIELAVNTFQKIWSDDTLDINIRLFIAYTKLLYAYLTRERDEYDGYRNKVFGTNIAIEHPADLTPVQNGAGYIYGPFSVSSDMLSAGTIELSIKTSTPRSSARRSVSVTTRPMWN